MTRTLERIKTAFANRQPLRWNILVALTYVTGVVVVCIVLDVNAENVVMAYIGLVGGLFHSLLSDGKEENGNGRVEGN